VFRRSLLLATAIAVGAADPAFARSHELKIGLIHQQTPSWCWAASASMALKFLGFPDINEVRNYQCGVVAATFPYCEYDCTKCDRALDRMPTFVELLERYRDRAQHGRATGLRAAFRPNYVAYPEFDRIKRSIDRSYPVIGGVSLNGGRGTIFGAFTGILLLYLIQNVLTLGGVPAQWISALNGAIILIALIVSRITSGKAQD